MQNPTNVAELQAPLPLKVNWTKSLPFFLFHAIALIGVFFVPFEWKWVALCIALYTVRMFGITAGFHRYFSHRTYKTSRVFQFLLAFLAQSSAQKGALWWAANHRHHHRFSDQPEDIHSPLLTGFWWSHVGWILSSAHDRTDYDSIRDFAKYRELVWLNRNPHWPALLLAVLTFVVGGMPGLIWGFFVSTVLLWHGTFTINSLSHVYGTRRYQTTDTSRNNFWLALLTLGEGWHNNHHTYQSSTNQGFFWWEVDFSYYALRTLAVFGIVWDLRKPPLALLESRRILTEDQGTTTLVNAAPPLPSLRRAPKNSEALPEGV